ncbi:MAG: MMPL family transporter [Chitinophagaceae bacterium]
MWTSLARFILKYKFFHLAIILLATVLMGFIARKVAMSYEFTNAIPTNNEKYKAYQDFKNMFGEDGTMMAIGFQSKNMFEKAFLKDMYVWVEDIKKIEGVENILSIPTAIHIKKKDTAGKQFLVSMPVFDIQDNTIKDSDIIAFQHLPFYKNLLYNTDNQSVLTAIYINKEILKSDKRVNVIKQITDRSDAFAAQQKLDIHYSGLPLIRTLFSESVKSEMRLILLLSLALTAVILLLFFRSWMAMLVSLFVVLVGVVWALGLIVLFGYKITLLSALIAPLIVVIGVPNCIYFLNKYHTQYNLLQNKNEALIAMIERMGIVTLFTNLTAAIGFGVFYFTKSQILKEFGLVSGVAILVVFLLSLFLLPILFSLLKVPKARHVRYLENEPLSKLLMRVETWVLQHRKAIYLFWSVLMLLSIWGVSLLKKDTHIVDDLPKENKIYSDLKFFEKNFNGVMPLEILIDTKRKQGAVSLSMLQKMDEMTESLKSFSSISKPLSIIEAVKFARQAFYDGDSASYGVPNSFDISFMLPYLRGNTHSSSQFSSIAKSFTDSTKQFARISMGVADIGSKRLPLLLDSIQKQANEIFDTSRYTIKYTGTSVVFLEGSKFIISSLKDSLLLALLMITVCMLFLFHSWRIVLLAIITNVIPLVITGGIMGFVGIAIKPSTVLVFSIALGIAIDVTIRFLVNYKQDLVSYHFDIEKTVKATIKETGISIIYTSLVLSIGFIVFIVSQFDGTKALGYLTALTLIMSMITNLTLLPALLIWFDRQGK